MRVAVVLENLVRHNGRCRNAVADAVRLQTSGATVVVFCAEADSLADTARAAHLSVEVATCGPAFRTRNSAWAAWLAHRLTQWAPDVVHCHGYGDLWAVTRTWQGPLVASAHCRLPTEGWGPAVGTLLAERCDAIVAYGTATRDDLLQRGVRPSAITLITTALPADQAAWRPAAGRTVISTACRLDQGKGLDTLLAALAQLRTSIPTIRLRVIGAGPAETSLRVHARALGVDSAVDWLGWVESDLGADGWRRGAVSRLADTHLFVMPSRTEGLCGAVFEALAMGMPLCVSDAAAAGFGALGTTLVSHRDGDIASLTDALRDALHDARPNARAEGWAKQTGSATRVDRVLRQAYKVALAS